METDYLDCVLWIIDMNICTILYYMYDKIMFSKHSYISMSPEHYSQLVKWASFGLRGDYHSRSIWLQFMFMYIMENATLDLLGTFST